MFYLWAVLFGYSVLVGSVLELFIKRCPEDSLQWVLEQILLSLGPRSFFTDLAMLGLYCHDLGPIFPSTALALG